MCEPYCHGYKRETFFSKNKVRIITHTFNKMTHVNL